MALEREVRDGSSTTTWLLTSPHSTTHMAKYYADHLVAIADNDYTRAQLGCHFLPDL
jgi:hypothetical protein